MKLQRINIGNHIKYSQTDILQLIEKYTKNTKRIHGRANHSCFLVVRELQTKDIMASFISTDSKNYSDIKYCLGYGLIGIFRHCWWNHELPQPFRGASWI